MRSPRHSTTTWAGKSTGTSRLCRKTPSSARERAIFRLAKTAKQAILVLSSMQPDADRGKMSRSKPDRVFRHSLELVRRSNCSGRGLRGCYDSLRAVSLATRKATRLVLSLSLSVNGATYRSAANITESAMEKSISLLRTPTYAVRESMYSPAIA